MSVTLYGPRGEKIERAALREEESAPSLRSVRQVFSSYPSTALTPQRLANIFRAADQGDPHAQCELFEDMEEKDLHLSSVLGTRKRAVSGLEIKVEAPNHANAREKKAADLLDEHLGNIPDLPEKLIDVLDAIGKGYSVTEIIWSIYKQEAVIEDLRWREPKWFRFDQESMSELRMLDTGYPDGKPLTPYKYIRHIHKAKSGIAVRGGILRPCAWMYLFKNYDFKDWVTFAEIYAQPLRVGKYPSEASEKEKDVLLRAVANMGTDAAAIIPESMLIEFVEAGGKTGSTDLYERLARFCDEQTSKGVLGQTSTSDAMSHGLGSGQAELHGEVRHDLLKADARQLTGTLSRDIGRPIIDLNMGPVDRYPRVTLVIEDPEDMDTLARNTERLHRMGLPISSSWLYKKFNIPAPEAGEQVLPAPVSGGGQPAPVAADVAANAQDEPRDIVDDLSDQLDEKLRPEVDNMIDQVRQLMAECSSLQELRDRLPEVAGDIDPAVLSETMARAFSIADLAGRHDVSRGE